MLCLLLSVSLNNYTLKQFACARVCSQEQLQTTTEKLNDVVRKQKDEIDRLRRDNRELQDHLDERQSANDKFDRKLLDELNEQCDRMTQYLNAKLSTYSSLRFIDTCVLCFKSINLIGHLFKYNSRTYSNRID